MLRLGDRELWARYLLFNEGADLEAKNGETTPQRVEPKGLSQLGIDDVGTLRTHVLAIPADGGLLIGIVAAECDQRQRTDENVIRNH